MLREKSVYSKIHNPITIYSSRLAIHSNSKIKAERYSLSINPANLPEPNKCPLEKSILNFLEGSRYIPNKKVGTFELTQRFSIHFLILRYTSH
ncbi:hypothetical protein SAMN04489796_103317 [Winogradskyella thalassocola]|uniref:Uncharacterized protein n=1 Tax=Winogradskyella thalassocola TaxID=262004 RepID=A0A1G8DV07_9FLAO|nr:hypothetical protein SAMN04489796_103317 [Winogradskyella thalassocola]